MNVDRLPDEMPESSLMGYMTMVRMEPQPPTRLLDDLWIMFNRPRTMPYARPYLIDGVWYWMA